MADTRLLLATLPLVAATMARKRHVEQPPEQERWWLDFRAAVPAPVWRYVLDLDPDIAADPTYWLDPDAWLTAHHPAFEQVIEAAHEAYDRELEAPLRHVQGSVLKWSEWRLGWAFAHDRAHEGAPTYDDAVRDAAAQVLLDWTGRESHAAWREPVRYIDRWRQAATDDPQILSRAGLHSPELSLLAADEGDAR